MDKRDDFSLEVKELLAKRVGYICSNPCCMKSTMGPQMGDKKTVSISEAAHICAAAPGGKRYDNKMTSEERSSFDNGIWLCRNCAALIDRDENIFTVDLLKEWKHKTESSIYNEISKSGSNKYRVSQITRYQYSLLLDNLVDCKKWYNIFSLQKHVVLDSENFPLPQNWEQQIENFVTFIGIDDSVQLNKLCSNIHRLKSLMIAESARIKKKYPRGIGRIADYESIYYCGQMDSVHEILDACFTDEFLTILYTKEI